jgi:ketosteroid isomerase-like protein
VSEEGNVRIVRDAYAAFLRGELGAVLTALADDVEWKVPGPREVLPFAGVYRGRRHVGEFFATLGATLEFESFQPKEFIAQGDKVVVLGSRRDRFRKTGRIVESDWAAVFTVRDRHIGSYVVYEDTAALVEAARPR